MLGDKLHDLPSECHQLPERVVHQLTIRYQNDSVTCQMLSIGHNAIIMIALLSPFKSQTEILFFGTNRLRTMFCL